ncbi:fumarate reductase subunit FrdC [Shewanella yunxiaonensis]|uniref:Fumarate reductase subunit FrdC n=1 Tax=Shewanella yunxiaonensis TaxID=2829809 RepID=A0ABX7YRZ8_9GAMM|nr:fumarate reductase subunit FrdC [Shewanella yunxiaonensis]QUN05288.1 fumarate reductase subunit FrdC [Shewanella yunxiaonensis]
MQNRKPYVRPIHRTWFAENNFFSWYMVRELTIVPLIIFTLSLTYGLYALVSGREAFDAWIAFCANPVMLVINVLAMLGALYHAKTFFSMMPKVMPIKVGDKKVSDGTVVAVQWVLVLVVSAAILALV